MKSNRQARSAVVSSTLIVHKRNLTAAAKKRESQALNTHESVFTIAVDSVCTCFGLDLRSDELIPPDLVAIVWPGRIGYSR